MEIKNFLGKENTITVYPYFINLRDKVIEYTQSTSLGIEQKARNEEKYTMLVAKETIELIKNIISKKQDNIPLVNKNNLNAMSTSDLSYDVLPIHQRPFQTLLSSKDADKAIVDKIYYWLKAVANIDIWYDSRNLPPFVKIDTELSKAILNCRSMILILSESTISKEWIRKQYQMGVEEQRRFKDFRILPLRIGEFKLPDFLENLSSINLRDYQLDFNTANELLISLFYNDMGYAFENREIYVSRTWRDKEAVLADNICKKLIIHGFKLIGDSKDQQFFYGKFQERIKSIIKSCGGLVAILPHRGDGTTSPYILEEIEVAMNLNLPCLIIAEPNVQIPEKFSKLTKSIIRLTSSSSNSIDSQFLHEDIVQLRQDWKKPTFPHEVFFATDIKQESERRNQIIKDHIERITSMACIIGDKINVMGVQNFIVGKISNAFIIIADISEGNINSLIEAGIALGTGTKLHLIARGPRKEPPFMFADQQVLFYSDDLELLGIIHSIVYNYRRRVLNYELKIN